MTYCGYIAKIQDLRKHSNADRLQVVTLFGNDVIVGLDVKVGDLVVYFPTDGRLSEKYVKENKLSRSEGGYLDDNKRQVTTIRLRGEMSDGLIMPVSSLSKFGNISSLIPGDKIDIFNGELICEKYIPQGKKKINQAKSANPKDKKKEKESFPFFEQHVDTAQLAYNVGKFKEGDLCYITLKIHGTSQRTARTIKKKSGKLKLAQRLLHKLKIKQNSSNIWEYISGTRRVTLKNFSGGYYGGNQFREQWHEFFKGKLHKGESIYYETVGFINDETLIMPECDNRKTKDKDFIKKYGEKTRFTYGCEKGESDIYVYRMTKTDEDGHIVEYPWELVKIRCEQMGVKPAPEFDKFLFTTAEDMWDRVKKYESGTDPIGSTHIREGVIVRIENREKFTALKQKSFDFKVLEGLIKADDVIDIEESESTEQEV